ncbi:uncharacterized protein LOC122650795 [Telopea speciosissima]|uniref:uncharacterized protein LOC122650795 n=1 Tax=Telopea speciosissima TaxID=54955 RepID=UPI001CC5934E|nr:uncharacterized protein LOC122650795 [Telopea speciosissima]
MDFDDEHDEGYAKRRKAIILGSATASIGAEHYSKMFLAKEPYCRDSLRGMKETESIISVYFNLVLGAILQLYPVSLKPPSTTMHQRIAGNRRSFYPYFRDCIGAVNSSHIHAWVPVNEHKRFRDRKGIISQNILTACDFDSKFTYILADWEGSASDSRILDDAIHRQGAGKIVVPPGKYYLVDAGFANQRGFLRPYQNVRYHLKEWENNNQAPADKNELFNLRHSKLRNVIEHALSLLKSTWKIMKSQSEYPYKTQTRIVQACVLLHNHILNRNTIEEEEFLDQENAGAAMLGQQIGIQTNDEDAGDDSDKEGNDIAEDWEQFQDDIADKMWADYIGGGVDEDDYDDEDSSDEDYDF